MGRIIGLLLAGLIGLVMLSRCGGSAPPQAASTETTARPDAAGTTSVSRAPEGGEPYTSADTAEYFLMEHRRLPNGNVEALTRREGSSGVSYARREYACGTEQFRYLSEGDTADAARGPGREGEMSPLVTGSSSYHAGVAACGKYGVAP